MDNLLEEARKDIQEIKQFLSSIDKHLALSTQKLDQINDRTAKLETRIEVLENQVIFVNAMFKLGAIIGGAALFIVEVLPLIHRLFN